MIPHGRDELVALAEVCSVEETDDVAGWGIEWWEMESGHVDAAIEVYRAVLLGDIDEEIEALLLEENVDASALLIDYDGRRDDTTRSDLTELAAAATVISADEWDVDSLHLPNVPKMSRRKSDSGFDILATEIGPESSGPLSSNEQLLVASVKHTVTSSSSDLRGKLVRSLSAAELTTPYVQSQLRVLSGRLRQEGLPREAARRVYLFGRRFPDPDHVRLVAVAVVAPDLAEEVDDQLANLPNAEGEDRTFRTILMPELRDVHDRCP